jgi:SAM-dependent methyltransferase
MVTETFIVPTGRVSSRRRRPSIFRRGMAISESLFRLVTVRDYVPPAADEVESDYAERSVPRFLDRFDGRLDFAGKTVLDVGCGLGVLSLEAARRGAAEVVGIDLGGVESAQRYLRERAPELADRVRFLETDGSLGAVAGRQFDLVLSKDSFEHYADPESFIRGGLNKMTLRRFRAIVAASGLECDYFATNVSDSRVVKLMGVVSRIPPLREYFTQSAYTILRKPA